MNNQEPITAVVLAGGRGARMQGRDKGLVTYEGHQLIDHVLMRMGPQVQYILINVNRNQAEYARRGYPLVEDQLQGFQGPLAGMAAGLEAATTQLVAFVPCDMPDLPTDLVQRLEAGLRSSGAAAAAVFDGQRLQPVCCVVNREQALESCARHASHNVAVRDWLASLDVVEVDFSDCAACFGNINYLPADQKP